MSVLDNLVGVQPLMAPTGKKYSLTIRHSGGFEYFRLADNQSECLKYPGGHYVVDIRSEVDAWLKEQPKHMWKYAEESMVHIPYNRAILNHIIYTFLLLRFG